MAKFDESLRWLSLHRIRTSYLQLQVKLFGREPCTSVFKYDVRLLCREGSAETFIKFCPSAAASPYRRPSHKIVQKQHLKTNRKMFVTPQQMGKI